MKTFLILLLLSFSVKSQIKFDADFESGNIHSVETSDSINYTVRSIEDIGGRWFYFRISGVQDKFIRVNIPNSDVTRPMYSYDNNSFERFSQTEAPSKRIFEKAFERDTVYIAYYTPYNYSYLQERISDWSASAFVNVDTLGFSSQNFPMQELTITDFDEPDEFKYRVWIHSRTHPGETPSSWHLDGFIQKLLSGEDEIAYYRKNIIFYIVPFNNPEGVYFGRSRTNYFGVDQEREWNKTDEQAAVEVKILRDRLKQINDEKVIDVFLNLHSQASPFCTFFIHTASSTSDYFYRRQYQFSNLNVSDNPYFQHKDLRESNLQEYFPEGWLWKNYGDKVMALTYESPYDYYSSNIWVTNENLYELGHRMLYAIAEYLELSHPKRIILDNKDAVAAGFYNQSQSGLEFYSNDYFLLNDNSTNNSVVYNTEVLKPGKYDVYGWWQSNSSFSFQTKFEISAGFEQPVILEKTQRLNGGQWNFLTEIEFDYETSIQIKVESNTSGKAVADAFRINFREPITNLKEKALPQDFKLYQNYPNPFNPNTTIRFDLTKGGNISLRIFNALGQLIDTLADGYYNPGTYEVLFNSKKHYDLASGTYYYQLLTASYSETKTMVFIK